jgi:hypothetical protein
MRISVEMPAENCLIMRKKKKLASFLGTTLKAQFFNIS